jgi:4-hydroxybenzoate polyprenyltransferase
MELMEFLKNSFRLLRPVQWIKNLLVFSGILFGGQFSNSTLWLEVIITAIAFCFVSSSVYVLNDIYDCENDKAHPKKKTRPIASGNISLRQATALTIALGLGGLGLGSWVSLNVFYILLLYLVLNIAYSTRLKHVVILDVFCISAGFMLRILAGTVGVDIPPSRWLVLCGIMVTLFLGFAKRRSELISTQFSQYDHRQVLSDYTPQLLDHLITICVTGTILTYSLYTMSADTIAVHHTENLILTVPFVIYALFRYLFLVHVQKSGGDPTNDLIKDRHIAAAVLSWLVLTIGIIQG